MYKTLLIALMVFAPVVLLAQNNDLGVFVSSASYSSTTFSDPDSPGTSETIKFDRGSGQGLSYDRFWTPSFSTELAYVSVESDVSAKVSDGADQMSGKLGDATFSMWTAIAKWHVRRFGRTMPYVGAGLARIDGSIDVPGEVFETDTFFFNSDTSWVANVGVAYAVTPIVVLALDARYVPYSIDETDGERTEPSIDVNPLIISAGIHWRF